MPDATVQPPALPFVEAHRRGLERARRAETAIAAGIVSAVALVLGLYRLDGPSLWLDETFTARAIAYPYPDLLLQYHWVFYSVEKAWTALAGTSEWALRMPAVFAAMLASAALVVLARRLFDRWVALVSGLLLATSPFFVKWSQQARGYTLLAAAAVVAALLLLRALERGSSAAWLVYGLGLSAVILIHPIGGLVLVPAHAVLVLLRRADVSRDILVAGFPVLLLGFTWAGTVSVYATGDASSNPLRFPSGETVLRAFGEIPGIAGLGLVLAVAGLWTLRRAGESSLALWLGTWAFAPFLLTLVASLEKAMFLDRYLIVTAPAFALLAAVALRGLTPRLLALVGVLVVAATMLGLAHWYGQGVDGRNWHGEGWRPAFDTVYRQRAHRGPVLVIPFFAHAAPRYYGVEWVPVAPDADSVWALHWSESGRELEESSRRALGLERHRLVETIPFGRRLTAQHWIRTSSGSGSR